jgi:hypothetical protein
VETELLRVLQQRRTPQLAFRGPRQPVLILSLMPSTLLLPLPFLTGTCCVREPRSTAPPLSSWPVIWTPSTGW